MRPSAPAIQPRSEVSNPVAASTSRVMTLLFEPILARSVEEPIIRPRRQAGALSKLVLLPPSLV